VFRFDDPVARVDVLTIEATAQMDRQISIVGVAPGERPRRKAYV
jgi:hypothetical protein